MVLIMAVCCFAVSAFGAAGAASDEYGAKYLVGDDPELVDVDIINFKGKLRDLGFYSVGINENALQTKELDDLTMAAVKLVCDYNPDLTYYDDGVSYALFWRVMGEDGKELLTPLDQVHKLLLPGDEGDAVRRVQNRLNMLGYDKAGYAFTAGVYDGELQKAVDDFVRCNKLVYEGEEGITVELQELLFSDDAAPYEPAARGFGERVMGYLKSSGHIFGVTLPNVVIILIGFVLVCAIVLLIVRLAAPGGKSGRSRGGKVKFTIEYNGESSEFTADLKDTLHIGRVWKEFPLDASDDSVSRRHCELRFDGGKLVLQDTSSYGTKVNGTLYHNSQCALNEGDVIGIGRHRITVDKI